LFPRAKLLAGHTDNKTGDLSSEDYMKPTGLVVANPNDPNRWGIRNMSSSIWSVKPPNAEWRELEPGKIAPIVQGMEITFPNGKTVKISGQ
ncbi:MAG: hypothetical protein FWH02_03140, partial [Oscillospiraceae bacterium]|nr:hypothetical protein [Oscillospiraceae bacterium]